MLGRWFGGGGAGASYERGLGALRRAEYGQAIACFDQVLQRAGESDPLHQLAHFYRGDALGHLGRGALLRGDDESARAHFDAALATSPNYPDLRLARAVARLRSGDVAGALEDAQAALELNPRYLEAQLVIGQAHRELNEDSFAERAFAAARELSRDRDGDLAAALASQPPERDVLLQWILGESRRRESIQAARALLAQGFWTDARQEFEQLVQAHPRFPDLRSHLAHACFQLGEFDRAREHLHVALELHPEYADAALLMAVLELREESVPRAAELFAVGENAASSAGLAAYGRAVCAFLLGQYGECELRLRSLPDELIGTHWLRLALAILRGDERIARAALGEMPPAGGEDERLDQAIAAHRLGDRTRRDRILEGLPAGATRVEVAILRAAERPAAERMRAMRAALTQRPESLALHLETLRAELDAGELSAAFDRATSTPRPRCAESQRIVFDVLRAAARSDQIADAELAPPLHGQLQRLMALRQLGRAEEAMRLRAELLEERPLDLRLRLQDPMRWLRSLWRARPEESSTVSVANAAAGPS